MARFCCVAPTNILAVLDTEELMGSSHLLLAHDVVRYFDEYRGLFVQERRNRYGNTLHYPERWIILDNSVVELGNAVDVKMIHEAVQATKPSCVVLPDVMLDTDATIESCLEALNTWPQQLGYPTPPFLMIPQGKSLYDFTRCAEAFAEDHRIQYWGIPRNLVSNLRTRREAIRVCSLLNPTRRIHMMGFSDNLIDDMICASDPDLGVYSIDSAVPLRLQTPITLTSAIPPRGDWWDSATFNEHIPNNLKTVRRWCR